MYCGFYLAHSRTNFRKSIRHFRRLALSLTRACRTRSGSGTLSSPHTCNNHTASLLWHTELFPDQSSSFGLKTSADLSELFQQEMEYDMGYTD